MKLTKKDNIVNGGIITTFCVDIGNLKVDLPRQMFFSIKTYDKLKRIPLDYFGIVMNPINNFFAALPEEEKIAMALFYHNTRNKIQSIRKSDESLLSAGSRIEDVIEQISLEANDLFTKYGFVDKLRHIIKSDNIAIPDLKDAGKRQGVDRDILTWKHPDYIELSVIILICKIFCPIFGEMIHVIFKEDISGGFLKERFCMGVIKHIMENNFRPSLDKLDYYINNIISKRPEVDLGGLFKGYTSSNLLQFIKAALFVKKFVNINLYRPEGDIMVFVIACIKFTIGSIGASIRTKSSVKARFTPSDNPSMFDGDDAKRSNLEIESESFNTTIDTPILVRVGISNVIDKNIKKEKIPISLFKKATSHYLKTSIIVPTPVNLLLLGVFFGNSIGGANGMYMLSVDIFIKAITFLQFYFINNGFNTLVDAVSIVPQSTMKEELTQKEHLVRIQRGAGIHYQLCQENFLMLDSGYKWNTYVHDTICDFITLKNNVVNTAPVIHEHMGIVPYSGSIFECDENILNDIYRFTALMLSKEIIINNEESAC